MVHRKMLPAALALAGISAFAAAQPASVYDRAAIEGRPDPEFGRGTAWAAFIENEFNGLAVAPDGSVFLAQQRVHRIHKFDRSGRLVKSFGRRLREITLDHPPLKWTDALWRRYLEAQVEEAIARRPNTDPQQLRRNIEKAPRVSEYLPYFTQILTDAEGRLIVLLRGDCFSHCDHVLRVFTPEGYTWPNFLKAENLLNVEIGRAHV